jgi:ribosomal protein S18 acetylase RimI-like enzyme
MSAAPVHASGSAAVTLRQATAADLTAMARVHRAAYSREHFMARLPEAVLSDYYERFLAGGSQAILAVVRSAVGSAEADDVLGFAVFGREIESRIAAFKRERRRAVAAVALRYPLLATRKALMALGTRFGSAGHHDPAPALLLSIAVARPGGGVGRLLMDEIVRRNAALGERRLGLYVRHANVGAINLYLRAGFRIVASMADQYYMERGLSDADAVRTT